MNNKFIFLVYFLILIIPYDYRISAIFSFFLLLNIIIWKILNNQKIILTWAHFFILSYIIVSFYFFLNSYDELNVFLRIALYPFLLFLLFKEININHQILKNILKLLSLMLFVSVVAIFFSLHIDFSNFSLEYLLYKSRQSFEFWDNETILGPTQLSSIAGISFITLFFFVYKKRENSVIFLPILLILFILIIFLSSRNTWISITLSLFLLFVYKNGRFNFSSLLPKVFITFLISYLIIFNSPLNYYFNFSELSERVIFFLDPYSDHNLNARFIRWGISIEMISNNYFGYGFSYFGETTNLQTPHNELLGQLVSVGFLGTFFMLNLYIMTFRKIIYLLKNNNFWGIYFFIFFIFLILLSVTEYFSFAMYNLINPVVWIIFGIIHNNNLVKDEV